jgi:hypothetical protein
MPPKTYKCDPPRSMTLSQLLEEIKLTNEDLVVGNKVLRTHLVYHLFRMNAQCNCKTISYQKNHFEIFKINQFDCDFRREISNKPGVWCNYFTLTFDEVLNQYSSADRFMGILNNNQIYFE